MKIKYEFATKEVVEVEVENGAGTVVIDSRRAESANNQRQHYHCPYSINAKIYEGKAYATPDFTDKLFSNDSEFSAHVWEAFSHLTQIQQRRLLMLAGGLSILEISKREKKNYRAVYESIEAARKKFLKFY